MSFSAFSTMIRASVSASPGSWQAAFAESVPTVTRQEAVRWAYVLRVVVAGVLALGFSMVVDLEQPATSLITVFVVMQSRSGAILAKSFYRMLGNVAGGIVAVSLFFVFEQQREFIIGGLAIWVVFCTTGSAKQRNSQSYGFVLAGYTSCIIALPMLNNPDAIFTTAILRISEILVGIVASSISSELIFPDTVTRVLYTAVEGRFSLFDDFVAKGLTGSIPLEDFEAMQLRFISDVALLDGYGASASFEIEGAAHSTRVRLFNSGFMTVSSSFSSLYRFALTLSSSPENHVQQVIHSAFARIAAAMTVDGTSARTVESARISIRNLEDCSANLQRRMTKDARTFGLSPEDAVTLCVGARLVRRFLSDMRGYLQHYVDLRDPRPGNHRRWVRFTPSIDKGIALVAGLRAGLLLIVLTVCWWMAAWPDANASLMVDFAVVFCALRAGSSNPARSLARDCIGAAFGVCACLVYSFFILPHVTDFVPLCFAYFPFLAAGIYAGTYPSIAGPARMYSLMVLSLGGPGIAFALNPPDLVSRCLSLMASVGAAACMHALFIPEGGAWWRNRLRKGLFREVAATCFSRLDTLVTRFESGVRDIVLQCNNSGVLRQGAKSLMLAQALAISDLGRICIELRETLMRSDCSDKERALIPPLVTRIGQFLERPTLARYRHLMRQLRTALHLLSMDKDAACDDTDAMAALFILRQSLMRVAEAFSLFDQEIAALKEHMTHAA